MKARIILTALNILHWFQHCALYLKLSSLYNYKYDYKFNYNVGEQDVIYRGYIYRWRQLPNGEAMACTPFKRENAEGSFFQNEKVLFKSLFIYASEWGLSSQWVISL